MMIKRRQNCQFLENSFNPFFNSPYATSFFHSQSPPRPLSLVNNFQMRWHGMVLVVRVHWSLCLFASIVLKRAESFSTDYASPTEPNTQAQALTQTWKPYARRTYEKHTSTHQHCRTESRFCIWTTTPYSGDYTFVKKSRSLVLALTVHWQNVYEVKSPWWLTQKELMGLMMSSVKVTLHKGVNRTKMFGAATLRFKSSGGV